jgi:hypothetical protein
MPPMLSWTPPQRAAVERALREHPLASGRCARAARAILAHATALDSGASALVIEPTQGIYLETTHEYGGQPWFHHVTVDAQDHRADGMTGVDGHPAASYIGAFFRHTDVLSVRPVQDEDWEWL